MCGHALGRRTARGAGGGGGGGGEGGGRRRWWCVPGGDKPLECLSFVGRAAAAVVSKRDGRSWRIFFFDDGVVGRGRVNKECLLCFGLLLLLIKRHGGKCICGLVRLGQFVTRPEHHIFDRPVPWIVNKTGFQIQMATFSEF